MFHTLRIAGVAAALSGASAAQAATLSAEELLQQYNLITKGDVSSTQEVEGNVYIGGNLNGTTLQADFVQRFEPDPELADVVILGDQNAILNMNPSSNSDVVIGGATNNFVNNLGSGGTLTVGTYAFTSNLNGAALTVGPAPAGTVLDPTDVFATLDQASTDLKGLATTGSFVDFNAGQAYQFGAGVFNIDLDDFTRTEFAFDLDAGELAIFNVSGKDVSLSKNFFGDFGLGSQIVWNFFEAETVRLGSKGFGAVLAGGATVSSFNGSWEGSVFADAANLSEGEIHNQGFTGDLPDTTPVPLPAGLPLLLAGLGAFGVLRARRH